MSRFLKPELKRIDLTGGDWILINRELTAGQQRKVFARTTKPIKAGEAIEIDLEKVGISEMIEYLVDWSFTNEQGQPVIIRDAPAEFVEATLNSLDGASFAEIAQAIKAHEAQLAREKKPQSTEKEPLAISESAA